MRSRVYNYLVSGLLLMFMAAGCAKDDTAIVSNEKGAVIISGGVGNMPIEAMSRAADAAWAAGDHVGITMHAAADMAVVNGYSNRDYVTDGSGSFLSNPESQKMYYPINGSTVTFRAYYPYKGLTDYATYPVNVSGQADIADLDLMTAVHNNTDGTVVNSKDKPNVHLDFYHRLSMVMVNLLTESGSPIDLAGSTLTIKGMRTTGSYNLTADALTTDAASVTDINIPLAANNTGRAILLPREAASGVSFEVRTADGGLYKANMDAGLELKAGSKYTFNLTLKTTPTLITASVVDWTDGPTQNYEVVHLYTPDLSKNAGFEQGHVLDLYAKDGAAAAYSLQGSFVYDNTAGWQSSSPIYWENMTGPTVDFIGAMTYAPALNTTQMPDYLTGAVTVDLYDGVHMEMKHMGAKVTLKLRSTDGTYPASELESAVVTLPGYINSASIDATGAYVVGVSTADITPEKQGSTTPRNRVAIFPAQSIPSGNTIVKVEIAGHIYEVNEGNAFVYAQGEHREITLDIRKSGVEITAALVDWVSGASYDKVVQIGTPTLGANENIPDQSQLYLFTEATTGAARQVVPGYFTYNQTSDKWNYSDAVNPLFWESLPASGKIYASMEYPEVNTTPSYNQSKDYVTAVPVDNNAGIGNTAIHFSMRHAVSQVKVVLRPSDTYTSDDLKAARILLPNYTIGGTLDKGVYQPGSLTGDIRLDEPNNTEISSRSYLQAQTIAAGQTVATIMIGTRPYEVTYPNEVIYNAGELTTLNITITGSELLVSVEVTDWTYQTPVELSYSFVESPTSVSGFVASDMIRFYKVIGSAVAGTDFVKDYTYNGTDLIPNDGTPWYRDDFANGNRVVAVFPHDVSNLGLGGSTFSWDCEGTSTANRNHDILVASDGVIADRNANVALTFKHVLSKVTVNLFTGTGFTDTEITGGITDVSLTNFRLSGLIDIPAGAVTSFTGAAKNFSPRELSAPNTGVMIGGVPKNAVLSYEAFIMPQTKAAGSSMVRIVLNGITYDASYTAAAFEFKAGEHSVLNITLNKTGLKLSATIADWTTGTSGDFTIE